MFSIPSNKENKYNLIRTVDQNQDFFCLLNSNEYDDKYRALTWQIAFGNKYLSLKNEQNGFLKLKQFKDTTKSIYGFLAYDLKNELEELNSNNHKFIDFPDLFFFEANIIIDEQEGRLYSNSELDFDYIEDKQPKKLNSNIDLNLKLNKYEYIETVKKIQNHILEGDVYELNFCIPFEIENIEVDPIELYERLNDKSPNPFSGILKIGKQYIISASPERYLAKRKQTLISQPIKGTIKRTSNIEIDKAELFNSVKERAENVMIVDLVRNDLTKSSKPGSIHVEELFGIYTFPQLHQMISTVKSELAADKNYLDAIRNSFPMGSMTGAPKVRAMQLIEDYEIFKRSAYSGALGYINNNEDFDFNVLIRSIFVDVAEKKLSFNVGSAITLDSDPAKEYEECLLKASAILDCLPINLGKL